jgi:hypothetical protein
MNSPEFRTRNRLLAARSAAELDLISPALEATELNAHQILEGPHYPISHIYFVESGLVSVVGTTRHHRIEVAIVRVRA